MATTATNKQPLLVDRVFHYVVDTNNAFSATLDVSGTNQAVLLVNAITTDGAIVEDLYSISRGGAAEKINLYLSRADDYLRPNEGVLVGKLVSSATAGDVTSADWFPKVLAPLPGAGSASQVSALYIPKGKALWCTLQLAGPANDATTPIIGAQGGFY